MSDSFSAPSFPAGASPPLGGLDDLELDLPPAPANPAADSYQQYEDWRAGDDAAGEYAQELPTDPDLGAAPEEAPLVEAAPPGAAWEAMLQEEFARKDKNGDGFLSMKEISIKELLELDVDHNGFISIEEFYGVFMKKTEATFQKQDLDRDGRLKLAEFTKGVASADLEAAYARFAGQPELGLDLDEFRNYLASQRDAKKK